MKLEGVKMGGCQSDQQYKYYLGSMIKYTRIIFKVSIKYFYIRLIVAIFAIYVYKHIHTNWNIENIPFPNNHLSRHKKKHL